MNNKKLPWVVVVCVIVVAIVILFSARSNREQLVGGDRDEHGCLGAAGYSWNESVGACVKEWELDDNQKDAAGIAVDFVGRDELTVVEVLVDECPGCFLVKLANSEYVTFQVTLSNWVVEIDSFEDCAGAGYPVMESYPRQCSDGSGTWTEELGSKNCVVDSDCVVFGRDGDCNCGCYNKGDLPSGTGGECFCAAPESCECIDGVCEGVFGV